MTTAFIATQDTDGTERIMLMRQSEGGLFRRASSAAIPVADWIREAPRAGLSALASARAMDATGDIIEDEESVILPPALGARLSEVDAGALGLPPASSLTLQLVSNGSLTKGSITVDSRWVRRGGVPVRADVIGARVRQGSETARLPEPLYSAHRAAEAVANASDDDERRARFAELRQALGEEFDDRIDADGFIERIRIAYAANFSIDAKASGGALDFDPVLFARHVREDADKDLVDASEAGLLTAADNTHFQQRFRGQTGGRRSYLLADGAILFLDPGLGDALDIVRQKQTAPPEERRAFLRAPQKALRESLALDADGDDEAADRLFIETQQFSERVSGIEIWEKPVLPWIRSKPNSWLPEGFGLRIGEAPDVTYLELEPGDAETLVGAVAKAQQVSEDVVPWGDANVPATPATAAALRGIVDLEREATQHLHDEAGAEPAEPLNTFFLQVGQNFEHLDYARLPQPQTDAAPIAPAVLPPNLRSTPKPHQETAFQWLATAWTRKLPGVLLADDMGLGKTFEALAFLSWLKQDARSGGPVLIVAPTGLLRNWQNEIALHLEPGALGQVVEAFGRGLAAFREAKGSDIRGGTSRLNTDVWRQAGVVLTTYETMRDYHMSFATIRFAAIVYDEVQKLKNPSSQMTRAAKALNSDIQIALTGTPVENRLQDLWSISDIVYPGLLGTSREFEQLYPANDRERLSELQAALIEPDGRLPPFMLRRMKEDILTGLPEKRTERYNVPMPPEQVRAYDLVLARARALKQSGSKGAMLKVLHLLRGTSLHPRAPHGIDDIDGYVAESARLSKTFALLADIQVRGEKALIFCEDLEMQAFLALAVQDRFGLAHRPDCINGAIAGAKRQDMVARFQARPPGFDVMILSPKAGGVGLTITAANHVIHLSRWWNPAVEDQATDRVYRIGQDHPVTVHLPLAIHPDSRVGPSSFDRSLDNLMSRKRALSHGLLMPPETDADLEDLLNGVLGEATAFSGVNAEALHPQKTLEAEQIKRVETVVSGGPKERPVLSSRRVTVAGARAPKVGRVHYEEQRLRDWTIFSQYLEGAEVERLRIEDPYCCADRRIRKELVAFTAKLEGYTEKTGAVQVIAFDADSVGSRDLETSRQQREDLDEQWEGSRNNAKLFVTQRSRRATGDFHDRSVVAFLTNGDQIIWDLGHGIRGVMDQRRSCVVNATHIPAEV